MPVKTHSFKKKYTQIHVCGISIITQEIMEILALLLAENGVIFCYNHLRRGDYSGRTIFQNGPLTYCLILSMCCKKKRTNFVKEYAILRNTKHATKFGMTLFKDKM